jgi:Zn-dependent protease
MKLLEALEFGLLAILLYELAHVAVALALRVKVYQVGISWKGVYLRRERGTPRRNLAIALAGSAVTLGLALLVHRVSPGFALCSVVVGLANLLPIPASDGLRAFLLARNFGALMQPAEAPSTRVVDISVGRRPPRGESSLGHASRRAHRIT